MGCCGNICSGCCRVFLVIVGFLVLLGALVIVGLTAYRAAQYPKEYKGEKTERLTFRLMGEIGNDKYPDVSFYNFLQYSNYAALGMSCYLFISAILALISGFRKHRCCMGFNVVLNLIFIGGGIAVIIFYYRIRDEYRVGAPEDLLSSLTRNWKVNDPNSIQITTAFEKLMNDSEKSPTPCCGVNNITDFDFIVNKTESAIKDLLPHSCSISAGTKAASTGCWPSIDRTELLRPQFWWTIIVGCMIGLSALLAMMALCAVCCYDKSKYGKHELGHEESLSLKRRK